MPKLVYVYEGIDNERSTNKRTVLKNVRYFGGECKTEELWLKVAENVVKQYISKVMGLRGFDKGFSG